MIIEQLIKELKKFNPDDEVWFAQDEEGNSFHSKASIEMTDFGDNHVAVVIYPINSANDIS